MNVIKHFNLLYKIFAALTNKSPTIRQGICYGYTFLRNLPVYGILI